MTEENQSVFIYNCTEKTIIITEQKMISLDEAEDIVLAVIKPRDGKRVDTSSLSISINNFLFEH